MKTKSPNSANKQRGQALTEFYVVAFALAPLFVLVPVIAKYQDISHATQMAARYAAFEATVHNDGMGKWTDESQLAMELRRRFFSNSSAAVKTNDGAGNFAAHQNMFWRTPDDQPLISDVNSDVVLSFGTSRQSTHGGAFSKASDGALFPLGSELTLESRGLYTTNVSTSIANLPAGIAILEPFDNLNLSVERSTTLLVDTWTADSPGTVEGRISASPDIYPKAALAGVEAAVKGPIAAMEIFGGIEPPKMTKLDDWRDVVPDDRLKGGR